MNEDTSKEEVVEETVSPEEAPVTTPPEPSTPAEESQEEKPRVYAGKYNSPEELEKAYKEAQRLISEQGSKLKAKEALPPDKQEILNELQSLGVVTKADLDKQQAVLSQKAKDDLAIRELKISDEQEQALRRYSQHQDNLSKTMTELWDELQGTVGGKVISRKTTIKPKAGSHESSFKVLSQEQVAKLNPEAYDKYWVDYAAHKAAQ